MVGRWCLVGGAGLKPAPTGWLDGEGMIVVGEGVAAVRGCCCLVGVPLAAPGIPRSRRSACSRPFRRAKGAWVLLV